MFIREVKKQRSKTSKIFHQYNLVQTSRVNGKVKQRVILYLGSEVLMQDKKNRKQVLEVLKAKIFGQSALGLESVPEELQNLASKYYEKYRIKYGADARESGVSLPPAPQRAEMHAVDVEGLAVKDVRSFGGEHLCQHVLAQLQLQEGLEALGWNGEQSQKALIAIAARALFSSSEHKTAQILELNSELAACYDYEQPITYKQLYHISDRLYAHKDQIDAFLYRRITDLFALEDRLVIFDISNTYFETGKRDSKLARYGRSKEKRTDCPLVVFTGVINAQGFIRHSRIYEGSRPDVNTLEDMIGDLDKHSSAQEKKTVVMDAGIATEDNLALLRDKQYDYVCVSRKRLKNYPVSTEGTVRQRTDRDQNEVELSVFHPPDQPDTWMYVQSENKRKKEQSIRDKLAQRFEEQLTIIRTALSKKGGIKKTEKVWERIGRAKEKYRAVSARYQITVDSSQGKATHLHWKRKPDPIQEDKQKGVYFIRTSYTNPSEPELWNIYNTIREVESTFRCLKSDLKIRPVYHQRDHRIQAHIYLTLLAYQLVNTIRHQLQQVSIHYDWQNILRIMATQTIQTVQIPTDTQTIHLRKPAKPINEVQQIYKATNCNETHKSKKKYVVYH